MLSHLNIVVQTAKTLNIFYQSLILRKLCTVITYLVVTLVIFQKKFFLGLYLGGGGWGWGGKLNLDQTGVCHWRLNFITLFWSGKTQNGYPVLELPLFFNLLYCIVLYCIVLYCIVLYCIVLYCIVLYCIVLYCIVLYCIVLYCIVLYQRQRSCLRFTYLIK